MRRQNARIVTTCRNLQPRRTGPVRDEPSLTKERWSAIWSWPISGRTPVAILALRLGPWLARQWSPRCQTTTSSDLKGISSSSRKPRRRFWRPPQEYRVDRLQGYSAVYHGKWRQGIAAVACALLDGSGGLVGAIGMPGPDSRMKRRQVQAFSADVIDAAREIGKALGHRSGALGASAKGIWCSRVNLSAGSRKRPGCCRFVSSSWQRHVGQIALSATARMPIWFRCSQAGSPVASFTSPSSHRAGL
ncbi:IclR family transcriptional regulator domain-containing protein [Arvimicrobium flavum]|uniref:IclR family transcriptional regulator domain-containing protein n=1 Tax=Arvimicrobium flavum TaxID=3393320 RepID=UPI00398D5864